MVDVAFDRASCTLEAPDAADVRSEVGEALALRQNEEALPVLLACIRTGLKSEAAVGRGTGDEERLISLEGRETPVSAPESATPSGVTGSNSRTTTKRSGRSIRTDRWTCGRCSVRDASNRSSVRK